MRYENYGDPVYAPNTVGGPQADPSLYADESYSITGEIVRAAYTLHSEDDDYGQPRALYENVLGDADRANLAGNIVGHASRPEVTSEMKARVVEYWRNVSKDLGDNVSKGLGVNGS
jgi:catalase